MKFLFLIFIVGAIAFTQNQKETLRKHSQQCIDETHIEPETVEKYRNGDWAHEDEHSHKYWFCMFKKSEVITDDGHFKKDEAMATISKDEPNRDAMEQAMEDCMHEHGATPEETAFRFMKCYHNKRPDHDMF